MKRLLGVLVLAAAFGAAGCGGNDKALAPTTDKDAIKKEQERIKNAPDADPRVKRG